MNFSIFHFMLLFVLFVKLIKLTKHKKWQMVALAHLKGSGRKWMKGKMDGISVYIVL